MKTITDEEIEHASHINYPFGSTSSIGSKDRAMYEEKKMSFESGAKWTIAQMESQCVDQIRCDTCGCHPSVIVRTQFGTFCQQHARYI